MRIFGDMWTFLKYIWRWTLNANSWPWQGYEFGLITNSVGHCLTVSLWVGGISFRTVNYLYRNVSFNFLSESFGDSTEMLLVSFDHCKFRDIYFLKFYNYHVFQRNRFKWRRSTYLLHVSVPTYCNKFSRGRKSTAQSTVTKTLITLNVA